MVSQSPRQLTLPSTLLPTDGRFGSGPSKVRHEQLEALSDDAREKELRSLVAETPLALHEFRDADKHVQALMVQREHLTKSIAAFAEQQDALLDKLAGKQ